MPTYSQYSRLSPEQQKDFLKSLVKFLKKAEQEGWSFTYSPSLYEKFIQRGISPMDLLPQASAHTEASSSSKFPTANYVYCDPSTEDCCIHSGNIIPLTGGKCLGASYISCTTDKGDHGFRCNPLIFGLNGDSEYCVKKGEPHQYTRDCEKAAGDLDSESKKKFLASHAEAWDEFRRGIQSFCDGDRVRPHNRPNCEALERKTLGLLSKSTAPSVTAAPSPTPSLTPTTVLVPKPTPTPTPTVTAKPKKLSGDCLDFQEKNYFAGKKPTFSGGSAVREFIKYMAPFALRMQEITGLPASVFLAQAVVESSGTSHNFRSRNSPFGHSCFRKNSTVTKTIRIPGFERTISAQCSDSRPEGGYYQTFKSVEDGCLAYVHNVVYDSGTTAYYKGIRSAIARTRRPQPANADSVIESLGQYIGGRRAGKYKSALHEAVDTFGLAKFDRMRTCGSD
jgi:hypothetical protein